METTVENPQRKKFSIPFGFFAGPVMWAIMLFVGYGIAPTACQTGTNLGEYILSGVTALIILGAGIVAYRGWRTLFGSTSVIDLDAKMTGHQFLILSGALLSTLFFLLVVYTGVSIVFLNPCPVNTIPFP